jgi:hypothetical protein
VICRIADGYVISRAGGGMLFVEIAGLQVICCVVMVGLIICRRWGLTGLVSLWKKGVGW